VVVSQAWRRLSPFCTVGHSHTGSPYRYRCRGTEERVRLPAPWSHEEPPVQACTSTPPISEDRQDWEELGMAWCSTVKPREEEYRELEPHCSDLQRSA